MPSVLDAPVRVDHATYDLQDDQPQVPAARLGFWHYLVQYIRRQRVHMSSRTRSSGHSAWCKMGSPMARVAQEHPTLYLQGCLGIHNG